MFGQLQQDQQTAWNNYLNDWYNREQTAAIDDIAAQTAFDTADNTSYTARMETLEESTGQQAYETVLAMQSKNNNIRSTLSPTPAANVPTAFLSPPSHPDKTNTDPPTPPPRDRA